MSDEVTVQHPYLEAVVRRIVEVAKPDRIILFGSAARGDAGPDSDLDFLVVKAGVPHRRRLAREIYRALFGIPVPVDVIVVTPEDIEAFQGKVGTIIDPAMREGREIYAASGQGARGRRNAGRLVRGPVL